MNMINVSKKPFVKVGALLSAMMLSSVLMAAPPALTVKGSQITAGNTVAKLSGMSLFWSNTGWGGEKFYTSGSVKGVKDAFGGNLIRVAMGVEINGGYLSDPEANLQRVYAVVDEAIAQDMYVIIDWHSHYAHEYEKEAIEFFQSMARKYGRNSHVIYEVFNEPKNDVTWAQHVKPYAERVIKAIRAIDPDNLIIVGTTTWSQDVDIAANNPITGYNNIAYTLHFYAGTHGQSLRDKATTAMRKGIPLFVTEWGSVNATGDGGVDRAETDKWVAFMKQHSLNNANWALNDKLEGASALKPNASANGKWSDSALTESGLYVKNMIQSWPNKTVGSDEVDDGKDDKPVEIPVDVPIPVPDIDMSGANKPKLTCTIGRKGRWGNTLYLNDILVKNSGNTALNSWKVAIEFENPVKVKRNWSSNVIVDEGTAIHFEGKPYNSTLAAGQTVSFGFTGNYSGSIKNVSCKGM